MQSVQPSEITPQLRKLMQQAIASHEPLRLSVGQGENVVLLSEQDYHLLLAMLNQVQQPSSAQPPKATRPRVFGSSRGLIKMADDFDVPPDDFKEYM